MEKGVKYVQSNNKDTGTTQCYSISIVNVEQVNAGWIGPCQRSLMKLCAKAIFAKNR